MRFPVVGRDVYEDVMELLRSERMRTEELSRVIVNLKLSGASLTREATVRAPKERDQFLAAIDQNKYAARNPAIRAALMDYVERERAKETSPEKILDRLRNWTSVQRVDEDDDDDDTIAVTA